MLSELLAQIPPFDFLTETEIAWLSQHVTKESAPTDVILCDPADTEYTSLFIVSEGRIAVFLPGGSDTTPIQVRSGPTYFGEISVFFNQPRNARIVSCSPIQYYKLSRDVVLGLVQQNPLFRRAFASSLRYKQRIFNGYDAFMSMLRIQEAKGVVQLGDLVESYLGLRPVLHQVKDNHQIDFNALAYVLPRLPDHITSLFVLHLVEDLPEIYTRVQESLQATSRRAKKRRFYTLLPGKCMVLLRDRLSDTVDLVTKLCIYSVEMAKIRTRLQGHPVAAKISEIVIGKHYPKSAEAIWQELPFSEEEIKRLQILFGGDLITHLYEIIVQDGQMMLYFAPAHNRYETSASERWRSQIRNGVARAVRASGYSLSDYEIHIISGNEHSVGNCLSRWLHEHAETILEWGQQNVPAQLEDLPQNDQLYVAVRAYIDAHPDIEGLRAMADENQGIFTLDDTSFAGVSVTLLNVSNLDHPIDPDLGECHTTRPTLIINIDYAYGRQGELIMQNLILLFGKQIRSVSVFGKSGAVTGQRGDLLLPDQFLLQSTHELYKVPNNDLSLADFQGERPVHTGTLLTVLGTVMQSSEMLRYYRTFWGVIGMEMEGSFYLRELLQARVTGLIDPDVKMRFAYYTSDTPLDVDSSLSTNLSPGEGVPAVYAVTRAILKRILNNTDS